MTRSTIPWPIRGVLGGVAGTGTMTLAYETERRLRHNHRGQLDYDDSLESGAPKQALGALLLFLTNFGAILLSGLIVMAIYRVRATVARAGSQASHGHPRLAVSVVVAFVIVLAAPLALDSEQITSQQLNNTDVTTVAKNWANTVGWQVVNVSNTESGVTVRAIGPLPLPNPQTLRTALNANGLKSTSVQLELDPVRRVNLPGS